MRRAAAVLLLVAGTALASSPFGSGQWTSRGPINLSGLVTALLIDPENPSIYLAGTPAGIWTSMDEGVTWSIVPSIEGVNVAGLTRDPTNHDTLYTAARGTGVYKSTDRGRTWSQISSTVRPYSIAISADGSTILAATAISMRRSTDDGATWTAVTLGGVINGQVRFHPIDPQRALAVFPILTSDLEDTGFVAPYFTTDAGLTWQPSSGIDSKIQGLTMEYFTAQPSLVIAFSTVRSARLEKLWRSDDGGMTFRSIGETPTYGDNMRVIATWIAPHDPNVILTGAVSLTRTLDGGASTGYIMHVVGNTEVPHADVHGFAHDPRFDGVRNKRVFVFGDGGIYRTDDILAPTVEWTYLPFPNTQMYGFDVSAGGRVIMAMQDTGMALMEAGSTDASHPWDGDISTATFDRTDDRAFFVTWITGPFGPGTVERGNFPPAFADTRLGRNTFAGTFTDCFTIDPNDPRRMFVGSASILRLDGIQGSMPERTTIIRTYPELQMMTTIAVQPGNSNVVWVGRYENRGMDGEHATIEKTTRALSDSPQWQEVFQLPGSLGPIVRIVVDPDDEKVIYVLAFKGLLVTNDGGATWRNATESAPPQLVTGVTAALFDFVRHPFRTDWWYIAGLKGLYATSDAGATWQPADTVIGRSQVTHLLFAPGTQTLWASVWSRGLWSLDIPAPTPPRKRVIRP